MIVDRFLDELRLTSERYQERSAERARTLAVLKERGILHADDHERVKKRLRRLNASWALARELEDHAGPPNEDDRPISPREPALYGADVLGLERLMGTNDLIDVRFLQTGAAASRSVGRITAHTAAGPSFGTGFLVASQLLLTNNHVLASAEEAARSYVEFDYQAGMDGLPLPATAFTLQPDRFFVSDEALDFTLVAVTARAASGVDLTAYGFLRMVEQQGKVILGESVNIIQHPNGQLKQLALRDNKIVDLLERFVHYETDTSPGSSGSPVFNDQWEVVALHHSGVPKVDAHGEYVALDGKRWTPERGEDQLAWVANEGVRISRVLAELRRRELGREADALRAELLEAARAPQPRHAPPLAPTASRAAYTTSADGTSFTVPLRVTISVGSDPPETPSQAGAAAPLPSQLEPLDPGVRAALAAAEASRNRPYFVEAVDAERRERYYADITPDLDGRALFEALSQLTTERHSNPRPYDPKAHVYPWVDLHPDLQLRSIYSGKTFPPQELIRQDARIEAAQQRLREALAGGREASPVAIAALEAKAQEPFNCEHVVPQSSFAKKEPMKGDLHHLFACESDCNSFRGNTPYFDFPDFEEKVRHDCGRREGSDADAVFEPSNGKGAVARATLYFLLRYPGLIGDRAVELQVGQLPLLLEWHRLEPVGEWERHRNTTIEEIQGNRNPLIDHPEWATKIDFAVGFGSPA